jgi:NAD(P)H dehydrogenase (quinone)
VDARLAKITTEWSSLLHNLDSIPSIPFNKMAHWGTDVFITPDSPVYSPFIRRKKTLQLE